MTVNRTVTGKIPPRKLPILVNPFFMVSNHALIPAVLTKHRFTFFDYGQEWLV